RPRRLPPREVVLHEGLGTGREDPRAGTVEHEADGSPPRAQAAASQDLTLHQTLLRNAAYHPHMLLATLGLLLAVHLGPETPIGLRTFGAAASGQYEPAAAWNGHTGLVVWSDSRGTYPADTSPVRDYVESMLRVSPMRADGSLVNPGGAELFAGWNAHLASNGSSFMLAYSDRKGIHVVPLNESGMP